MGILADSLRARGAIPTDDTAPVGQNNFVQGLRNSVPAMGAQLHALAASGGRTVGANEFAAAQDQAAQQSLRDAQEAEAQVENPTWDTVHDLRGGANWLGYKAGQLAPALVGGAAAGAVGGLTAGPVGAVAAPTALFTPLEAGDIALRNPKTTLAQQLGGGLASSTMMNALPGMLGGRFVGAGVKGAAKEAAERSLRETLIQQGGENVLGQAAGMGGGEAIKQVAASGFDPNVQFDPEAIKEAALGGAVMGLPMAGAHIAADVATGTPRKALKQAQDAISAVPGAETASKAADSAKGAFDRMRKAFTPKEDDGLGKVADGQPLNPENEIAGEAGQKANDLSAMEKVKAALHEMAADVGISPETRQSVEDTLTNLATSPSAVRMGAALAKGWKATKDKAADLKQFAEDSVRDFNARQENPGGNDLRITDKDSKTIDVDAKEVKHSDDFSGERKVITDVIAPWLKKNSPETLNDPEAMQSLGELFRQVIHHTYTTDKPLPEGTRNGLFRHFGEDATRLIDQIQAAAPAKEGAEMTNHANQMGKLSADRDGFISITKLVQKALDETGNPHNLNANELTGHMLNWATRDSANTKRGGTDAAANARSLNEARQVQELMDGTLGKHSKKIMKALEAEVERQSAVHEESVAAKAKGRDLLDEDEPTHDQGEGDNDSSKATKDEIVVGGGRRYNEAVPREVADRMTERLQKEYPDRTVTFKTEKDLGKGERTTHGYAVVEKLAGEDNFHPEEYKRMAFNTKAYGGDAEHPSRIDINGGTVDATRVEAAGRKHMARTGVKAEGNGEERRNQALLHGLAQLKLEHPEADIHDGLVVRHTEDGPVTLGDIKGEKVNGTRAKERSRVQETLSGLDDKELREVTRDHGERVTAAEANLDELITKELDRVQDDTGPMSRRMIREETARMRKDPDWRAKVGLNKLDERTKAISGEQFKRDNSGRTKDLLDGDGKTDVGHEADIHTYSAVHGQGMENENAVHHNLDNSPRDPSKLTPRTGGGEAGRVDQAVAALKDKANDLIASIQAKTGLQSRTGRTLGLTIKALLDHVKDMNRGEFARLSSLVDRNVETSRMASVLATLRDKYLGEDWSPEKYKPSEKGEMPRAGMTESGGRPLTDPKETERNGTGRYANTDLTGFSNKPGAHVASEDLYTRVFGGEGKSAEGRAAGEGPNSPKAQAAGKAASSGKSLERMQKEFPDLTLRHPTAEEHAHISSVLDQLQSDLGERFPELQGVTIRDGEKSNFGAKAVTRDGEHHIILSKELFDGATNLLGSEKDKVERALTHEVGHLVDRELGDFSDTSDRFFADGDLHTELKDLAATDPRAQQWFGYALRSVRTPQRELFAQAFSLFHYAPEALREAAPETYKFFDAISQRGQERVAAGRAEGEARVPEGAKKDAFVREVHAGNPEVIREIKASDDPKSLQRAAEALAGEKPTPEVMRVTDAANERIGEILHDHPDAAYGMQLRDSAQATANFRSTRSAMESVREYLDHAVPWVRQELKNFMRHAGEFDPRGAYNVIRVAVNALNPLSTAYHESMHAFVHDLMTKGHAPIVQALQAAADSPTVQAQMKHFWRNEIGVLRQLKNDPEERIAVMYQMWANGDLKLGGKAQGIFGQIASFFRKVTGHWTNEEHAEHIMDYFKSGAYADDRLEPSVVGKALMSKNLAQVGQQIRVLAKPITHLAEEVVGAGGQNLRDTGIPALNQIAETVKKRFIDKGADAGFIPAARKAYTHRANKLAELMEGTSEDVRHETLEALQQGTKPTTPEAIKLHQGVRDMLDEMHEYLTASGVKLGDMGIGRDYFPRAWDPHYLSKNKDAFMNMARNYPQWHNPENTYQRLVAADGSELQVVGQPGMGAKKERVLSFISHQDAAPFMQKDLMGIMSSYLMQGTRKAEWARRFGGDNHVMESLLQQARDQGATMRDMKNTEDYIKAVNGTLGDDLNPVARRLMGDMIVYQNIRLLPFAFFSGIVDPMGIAVRGGGVSMAWKTFKRGMAEIPAGLKGTGAKDAGTKLAEDLDVITRASLVHALGATYTQGVVGGTARKINDTFFRYNLMEQWNTSMRVGATEAALKFMQKHDAGAGKHSQRYMDELGLKKGDIQVVNGRVATSVHEGLTEAQAARVKSAVNQWVDSTVLRPDAADKAVWMSDPHYMLVSHLKQFVYAFHHTILGRVAHEAQHGNYSPAMALMGYVPIMIAADAAKGFIQTGGGTPSWKQDWDAGDYIMNGIERAGLFGVGQIGMDAMKGNYGSVTGPSIEQLTEAMKMLAGRESFRSFALHAMPANALYAHAFGEGNADPTFAD